MTNQPELMEKIKPPHPKVILCDFSRTLCHPTDEGYGGGLNDLDKRLTAAQGSYNFFDHFKLNDQLLAAIKDLRGKYGIKAYIFTTDIIQEKPGVKQITNPVFDGTYIANQLGVSKSEPSAYEQLAQILDIEPDEIVFIDDSSPNLEAARSAGLQTVSYRDNKQALKDLEEIFN